MRISRLRLANWKGFTDTGELTLDQVNVLIGRNNSGKSAVLKAILMTQAQSFPCSIVRLGENSAVVRVSLAGEQLAR